MTGAAIVIDDSSAGDTILSIKHRVFAANREMPVRRQRLVYRPGPRGLEALADDETLGGAGVARDGTAELDVLIEPLTEEELAALGKEVCDGFLSGGNVFMSSRVCFPRPRKYCGTHCIPKPLFRNFMC
jgi:hypothetical protein